MISAKQFDLGCETQAYHNQIGKLPAPKALKPAILAEKLAISP
jgi:hypothetical protein